MRAALATAAANEKALVERNAEVKALKAELDAAGVTAAKVPELEAKIVSLESEITSVSNPSVLRCIKLTCIS
jgi:hypothetical protein